MTKNKKSSYLYKNIVFLLKIFLYIVTALVVYVFINELRQPPQDRMSFELAIVLGLGLVSFYILSPLLIVLLISTIFGIDLQNLKFMKFLRR